jgi:hypothetical protein
MERPVGQAARFRISNPSALIDKCVPSHILAAHRRDQRRPRDWLFLGKRSPLQSRFERSRASRRNAGHSACRNRRRQILCGLRLAGGNQRAHQALVRARVSAHVDVGNPCRPRQSAVGWGEHGLGFMSRVGWSNVASLRCWPTMDTASTTKAMGH